MSRIRVAHITTVDMSLRYLLLNQLRTLWQAGYDIAGISAPGPNMTLIEQAGIRHIAVPMTRNFTPLADLVSLWRLYRLMRRERFTIVHTHTPKPGLLGQLAARLARVPVVINTIHGFYFHEGMPSRSRRFYIAMERVAARCSDYILSQNREDIETAIREKICSRSKISYLGNGIDVERFDRGRLDPQLLANKRRELGIPVDAPVVGFVGRLVAEKGVIELLKAAQSVRRTYPDARFLLVGPIDHEKQDVVTPEIVQEYALSGACIFTGARDDMPDLYALMDVFVLPSHREGFPRSPMEASAIGVPCVVTDIRGCRETVDHGRNGLLVPLADVAALTQAIVSLLGDRGRARQMGVEGRRMAIERFDEQLVFNKVKAEYERLLKEKGFDVPKTLSGVGAIS